MSGLICDVCGQPEVPMGGEAVCMGHDDGLERDEIPEQECRECGCTLFANEYDVCEECSLD